MACTSGGEEIVCPDFKAEPQICLQPHISDDGDGERVVITWLNNVLKDMVELIRPHSTLTAVNLVQGEGECGSQMILSGKVSLS